MIVAPGTRLGPYEVVAAIGAGGMGEVYRARDTRLQRNVAIKILPEIFAADPERLARFEREAQALAALNHPHIAQIYGIEESGGVRALVMELVDGETLADHIAHGPIPIAEALTIARHIVDALDAAHQKGIIHRDLKPANIKVSDTGAVKVLDFGLAKLADAGPANAGHYVRSDPSERGVRLQPDLSMPPTITSPAMMTGAGVLLGTAAYMAPEQARGKAVDKRADIWAFGVIVHEMLTGKRPFAGDTITDVLASIVKDEVDLSRVPDAARGIVRACLEKDPAKRLRDIADLSLVSAQPPPGPAVTPRPSVWRRAIPLVATALLAAAAAGTLIGIALRPSPATVTRLSAPLESPLVALGRSNLAISPDGRRIAYVSNNQLLVRDLAAFDTRTVAGTAFGDVFLLSPVFSPDGDSIAFFSSDFGIKRVPAAGGTATGITRSTLVTNGIAWEGDDIYFISSGRRLERVSSRGGQPQTMITFADDEDVFGPRLLPGGEHVLLTVSRRNASLSTAQIVMQSMRTGERKVIVDTGRDPHYLRTGHIVYAVGGVLLAAPFDVTRREMRGAGVPVVEGVLGTDSASGSGVGAAAQFAVADTGTLVYVPGSADVSGGEDIAIVSRDGTVKPLSLQARTYRHVRASPDGRRIAFTVEDGDESNVWIFDLDGRTAARRLTFGGSNRYPIWSADGSRLAFASDRDRLPGLFSQVADGSAPAERLTSAEARTLQMPESWSPPGDRLLYTVTHNAKVTLWTYGLRDKTSTRFGDIESGTPTGAVFSPDGRWIAYATDNTVFVQPFPPTGARYQVSKTNGGHHPIWAREGRELWYEPGPSQLLAVPVTATSTFAFGAPVSVPSAQFGATAPANTRNRDALADGRWVSPIPAYRASADMQSNPSGLQMRVVLNWTEELTQKVPVK
jgi:serine/threonine-protein kinase